MSMPRVIERTLKDGWGAIEGLEKSFTGRVDCVYIRYCIEVVTGEDNCAFYE